MNTNLFLAGMILAIVVGPLLTIWALNLLFGLAIETTLSTWFATAWLQGLLISRVTKK
jgi:antibiotic biosynthesis monooxygenase (ABM) superfamily enzyme